MEKGKSKDLIINIIKGGLIVLIAFYLISVQNSNTARINILENAEDMLVSQHIQMGEDLDFIDRAHYALDAQLWYMTLNDTVLAKIKLFWDTTPIRHCLNYTGVSIMNDFYEGNPRPGKNLVLKHLEGYVVHMRDGTTRCYPTPNEGEMVPCESLCKLEDENMVNAMEELERQSNKIAEAQSDVNIEVS